MVALDLQPEDKKKLDDLAHAKAFDSRVLLQYLEQKIRPRVEKYMGAEEAKFFIGQLSEFFSKYTKIIGNIGADGVSRPQMLRLLSRGVIYKSVVNVLLALHKQFRGPGPEVFIADGKSSVSRILEWIETEEPVWRSYLQRLDKGQRDRIGAWARGEDLPSAQQIASLPNNSEVGISWNLVCTSLLIARALDYSAKFDEGSLLFDTARKAFHGESEQFDMGVEISAIQNDCYQHFSSLLPLIAEVQEGMKRTVVKNGPSEWLKRLEYLQSSLNKSLTGKSLVYWSDWHMARWSVFSGDLNAAVQLYKRAFEGAMYRSGLNQKEIIEEALVVAASLKSADKVFLKRLKWSLINFGYDIPSVTNAVPSREFSGTVEDWEVSSWRGNLKMVFPERGWFPGVTIDLNSSDIGPIWVGDFGKIKPDFARPNKRIKIGEKGGRQKRLPQLVWFSEIENYDICRKLLKKGADVNWVSDAGDTAILMALEAINITEPGRSLDRRLFDLIASQNHKEETLNRRTSKKRLLPIISAVQSGKVDVVDRVLKLGADPNERGMTDEQTALHVCLKLIGTLKDPEGARKNQEEMPVTPEALDSIRRYNAGVSGFSLDDQFSFFMNNKNNPNFVAYWDSCWKARIESILENTDLNTMRDIARRLIGAGGDVDAEQCSPIRGYTPLMLAAELDERSLFEQMLTKGGNPAKTYVCPSSGSDISCWEITENFESKEVGYVLADIRKHFSVH